MKKFLSGLLTVSLFFGMGTSTLAAGEQDSEKEKAYALIDKTNQEIDEKINEAIEEADKLQAKYLADIQGLEGESTLEEATNFQGAMTSEDDLETIEVLLDTIEEKIVEGQENTEILDHSLLVEEEMNEINAILVQEENSFATATINSSEQEKYEELTFKYVKQLDTIITNLYNETLKMSQQTIEKVAKAGITAICTWIEVEIGGRWVWIDPIYVVGEN